jgi:membrane protein DedA with SNARE-associated domain
MEVDAITALILEYRYWILLPLSFIEGPIVAFFAGMLASAGHFNPWALAGFFFVRDIVVDLACYYLGYFGRHSAWINRVLGKLGVSKDHLDEVELLWHTHPGKTMFLSKLSYGVAAGFIVVAGLVKLPLKKFLYYGSIIAVTHYGTLLVIGFFFGAAFGGTIVGLLHNIPYVIGGISLIAIAYYLFKRRVKKELVEAEEEAEAELRTKKN